jgi:5'-3' exonuclease
MCDFDKYLNSVVSDITFELGSSAAPFEQLLSVLPATSSSLVAQPYRRLMTMKSSPLVKLGYYDDDFEIDYEGKLAGHMGVPLLPFVNYNEIHKAYVKMNEAIISIGKDPSIFSRNMPGEVKIY